MLLTIVCRCTLTAKRSSAPFLVVAQSVTPILCRVQAYEPVFTISNTPEAHLDTLNDISIKVYSNCFEILAHTSRELASKRRRAKHSLLDPGKTTNMTAKLKDLEIEHDRAVTLCHNSSTSQSMEHVKERLSSFTSFLTQNEEALKKVQVGIDRLVLEANLGTLDWISSVRYKDDHDFIKEKRARSTSTWLVEHPTFREWENSTSVLFWLEGTGERRTRPILAHTRTHLAKLGQESLFSVLVSSITC